GLSRFIRRKATNQSGKSCVFPVAESSAETLNACGEAIRPAFMPARVAESGRTAPKIVTNNFSQLFLAVLFG
ncbi:MAG: hypothetical protein KAR20_01160, partial [Candidatus Heimdallarchaeota archaeon]|nr:hypothetical protein [Candidatus Heimdallarchaeota archaeon]